MPFDLASAQPVGFDLASAKPVPPGKENSAFAAKQQEDTLRAQYEQEDERLPGFADAADFIKAIPGGAGQTFSNIGTAVAHPIDTLKAIPGAIGNALDTAGNAVMHPVDTAQKVGEYLKNLKPEQAGQSIGSMMAGGAAGKAAGVLGDVVGPSIKALQTPVAPTIRELAQQGVVTTPGHRAGPGSWLNRKEQEASSLPIGGTSIENRRTEASVKWSENKINDALKDAGAKPVPDTHTGRDRYQWAYDKLQEKYDALLPKMTGALAKSTNATGKTFEQTVNDVKADLRRPGNGIKSTEKAHALDVLDKQVLKRFWNGSASGETMKEIKTALDETINLYKGGNVSEQLTAERLKTVRSELLDMSRRDNPHLQPQLSKLDQAYAKYKDAARASLAGNEAGQFTPNQYVRALKTKDKSKDKNKFATGAIPGQREAEAAGKVLGNKVPNSGTPQRAMTALGLKELLDNPWETAKGVAASTALPLIYSKPVQKMLQNRALKKGGSYTPIGKGAPIAGAALAPGSLDQNGIGQ
jgi:hypothetical protein